MRHARYDRFLEDNVEPLIAIYVSGYPGPMSPTNTEGQKGVAEFFNTPLMIKSRI